MSARRNLFVVPYRFKYHSFDSEIQSLNTEFNLIEQRIRWLRTPDHSETSARATKPYFALSFFKEKLTPRP